MAHADVAIVGAGLCGLALADLLCARGYDVQVLEARARVGGRILSLPGAGALRYDLGPAWIWPHNARMLALADRLGLAVMAQHSRGRLVFQDGAGQVRRDLDFATMGDALRIVGGTAALAEGLAGALPGGALRLGARVSAIAAGPDHVAATGPDGAVIRARHAVLALPPRLAAGLDITPPLARTALAGLTGTPTWMAGQGKVVAIYDRPFWRDAGLSGDAISHVGPLVEIHDASAEADPAGEAALFGFLAPGAGDGDALARGAVAQLTALFGPEAASPRKLHVKSWARDPDTATPRDLVGPGGHPAYAPIPAHEGRIHFAGSETAPEHGGFLEGALEAAEAAFSAILRADAGREGSPRAPQQG